MPESQTKEKSRILAPDTKTNQHPLWKLNVQGKDKPDDDDDEDVDISSSRPHGMNVMTTAVFIVGQVAGCGVLALPKALNDTGWIGLAVIVMIAGVSVYTGVLLGRCWILLRERRSLSLDHEARQPYPAIGQAAFGKHCRWLVSFCVDFTCFGATVVFLLLASQNIEQLLARSGLEISFCVWLTIVAAVLCPLSWLGTPKDFWQIGLMAALTTAIACLMILVQLVIDAPEMPRAFHGPIQAEDFLASFGIISFGLTGHESFPTIQVDMRRPESCGESIHAYRAINQYRVATRPKGPHYI
ncbi:hypothetical protein RRG08_013466 [Elysia crispata]|uniref:Amino acid transporter transmembrane domain-containing protein n=1 Tax=Elysia crispata TaxID=231223 RepID=A0AAE1AFY8_9GAST|nr:hypothetical protein RRG08_013466 [Elysia crispata]